MPSADPNRACMARSIVIANPISFPAVDESETQSEYRVHGMAWLNLGWQVPVNAENTHQQSIDFASQRQRQHVSNDFPCDMKTAWQLNEEGGDTGFPDQRLPFIGERILLQSKQEVPDLTPSGRIEVQDHFLQFVIDLNSARHSPHHSTRPQRRPWALNATSARL
jgi:hypothetical protein